MPIMSGAPKIWGVKKAWDHVEKRLTPYQTVVTAVVANRDLIDGVEVVVQPPNRCEEEVAYLQETVRESYDADGRQRGGGCWSCCTTCCTGWPTRSGRRSLWRLSSSSNRRATFPRRNYAFDNGLLTLELTRCIESVGKHWVSELESSRHIQWQGQWQRVDTVADRSCDESIPRVSARSRCGGRNGETKQFWVFTKVVRLKRYGRKRFVIVHEQEALG